jgi:hydroxyacylglutathione hydrolase
MLFKRFYDDNLAQASYLVACEQTREAIVVDPNTDIAQYARAAGAERLRIVHVTETHIHADFVSGARALAEATGATLHLSAEGGKEWGYTDGALANAGSLLDGSEIVSGDVRLRALHTPGHTPEHLSFLVIDLARGKDPVGALTGDFVFVGEVGRPDLLERAAGARGNMEKSAARLLHSIKQFKTHPDHLQIWPGHGAGSACGRSLGSMPQSTLGYEKLFNWAFAEMSEAEFVCKVLEDQPVPPRYFASMKTINRDGGAPTIELSRVSELGVAEVAALNELGLADLVTALENGASIVDTRPAAEFAERHIPGTINIPRNKSFLNWLGALVPNDGEIYLITETDSPEALAQLVSDLAKIGFVGLNGFFDRKVSVDWKASGRKLEEVTHIDVRQLHEARGDTNLQIVDVRGPDEWRHGHLPGAIHIPLASLPDRIDELDQSAPIVLHCKGGSRSAIATSFLNARGLSNVSNLLGGYTEWVKSGFEVMHEDSAPAKTARRKS